MSINRLFKKPGTANQPQGTYKEVGPRGGEVVEIDKGTRLPPTQEKDVNGKSNKK